MKLTAHTTSITANTGFEPYLQVLEANKAPYYAWKFVPINQVEGVNPRSQLYQSLKNQNVLEIWSEGEASEDGYVWLLSDGRTWNDDIKLSLGYYMPGGYSLDDAGTITPQELDQKLKKYVADTRAEYGEDEEDDWDDE
jgi:hypothetical protein